MRLKKLYIKDYKNLKDFSLDFEKGNGLSILIGNNGSGKSNVLEAISGIFADFFKNKANRKIHCDYSLEYELDDIQCKIRQQNAVLRCYNSNQISIKLHSNKRTFFIKKYVPNNIIGLYSGEENRLWISFYESFYKAYIKRINARQTIERMHLMFINKYYWNVALLTLLLSNNTTLNPFIKEDLKINYVSKIKMVFDFNFFDSSNELLKAFINKINQKHNSDIEYGLDDLKGKIGSTADDAETFQQLMQAYMPKYRKIIKEIKIYINDNITIEQLSEGEKKLILVKTILEILSDEKTLILMDEPDAHLHEGRKPALVDMMREYTNRHIVVATHSPTIAKIANENELIYLESKNGIVLEVSTDKLNLIRKLASDEWNIMEAGVFLNSENPLILFEGKSDVDFVKRAIELLKDDEPKYGTIDADFLSFNGTGNAETFLKNIRTISETKKVIFFFDRDDGGKDGMSHISKKSKDDESIIHFNDFISRENNIKASFLPYPSSITTGDFMIEDYFKQELLEGIIHSIAHFTRPITRLPNLGDKIKKNLATNYLSYSKEDFEGFKPLLDKIIEIL